MAGWRLGFSHYLTYVCVEVNGVASVNGRTIDYFNYAAEIYSKEDRTEFL